MKDIRCNLSTVGEDVKRLKNRLKQKRYRQRHVIVDRDYFIWLQGVVNKLQKIVSQMEVYYGLD